MSYTADEVGALIDNWYSHRYSDRLWIRVRYADLDVALQVMPLEYYRAVLLVGLLGFTVRDAALALGTSKSSVSRWYQWGLEWAASYLSGEE